MLQRSEETQAAMFNHQRQQPSTTTEFADLELDLADLIKAWWIRRLDDDSVRQWVPGYCFAWLVWSCLATFWLPPVPTIEPVMGHLAYLAFVWSAIPGNLAPIIGMWMRHGGSSIQAMSSRLLFRDWMGLVLQAGGHVWCFNLLMMFQVTAWVGVFTYDGPAPYAGMTVFCAVMLTPWTFGALLLFAQCVRKIQRGMQIEQESP